jgi:peptide-methionine (S)-S-oxide reductase
MATQKIIMAGGCFWGMQDLLRRLKGVIATRVGYAGDSAETAFYKIIKHGGTNHAEAIEVLYDDTKISFEDLLYFFFQIHDPTTENRQGNDRGAQYRSALFNLSDDEKKRAEAVITKINDSQFWPAPIVTRFEDCAGFYEAEPEHQDYLERYPNGYTCHFIRKNYPFSKA